MVSFKEKIVSINRSLDDSSNSLKNVRDLSNELCLLFSNTEEIKKLSIEDKQFLYLLREKIIRSFFSFINR